MYDCLWAKIINLLHKNSKKSWETTILLGLFFFSVTLWANMFNTLSPILIKLFDLGAYEYGHLSSTYLLFSVIFLLPAGILLDRYQTKTLILLAIFLDALAFYLFSIATTTAMLKLSLVISGLGTSFCFIGSMRYINYYFSSKHIALATALFITMGMIGGLCAQVPMEKILEHYTWQVVLKAVCVFDIFILTLVALRVQALPVTKVPINLLLGQTYKAIFNFQSWCCGIFTSMLNLPVTVLGAVWGVSFLTQVHNFTIEKATTTTSMLFIGMIIGPSIAGYCSDRFNTRKGVMLIGCIVAIALILIITFSQSNSFSSWLLLFLLLGLFSSVQILGYTVVNETTPENYQSKSMSLVSILVLCGGTIFQPLFGKVLERNWNGTRIDGLPFYSHHHYQQALMIMIIGFIIALVVLFKMKQKN